MPIWSCSVADLLNNQSLAKTLGEHKPRVGLLSLRLAKRLLQKGKHEEIRLGRLVPRSLGRTSTRKHLGAGPRLLLMLRELQAGALRNLFPRVQFPIEAFALLLELVVGLAELGNGLFREELLQRPFLNVLCLVLLELRYEGDRPLKDRALVLLASGDDLGKLVDPFVDGLTTATLDWKRVRRESRVMWGETVTCLLYDCLCASCAIPPSRLQVWRWGVRCTAALVAPRSRVAAGWSTGVVAMGVHLEACD